MNQEVVQKKRERLHLGRWARVQQVPVTQVYRCCTQQLSYRSELEEVDGDIANRISSVSGWNVELTPTLVGSDVSISRGNSSSTGGGGG